MPFRPHTLPLNACLHNSPLPLHFPSPPDLHGIGSLDISFDLGVPFKPFDQLMGVLPAASAHALPAGYQVSGGGEAGLVWRGRLGRKRCAGVACMALLPRACHDTASSLVRSSCPSAQP